MKTSKRSNRCNAKSKQKPVIDKPTTPTTDSVEEANNDCKITDVKELRFNLDSLFKNEEELSSFYEGLDSKFLAFQSSYQNKLASLNSEAFNKALSEYENLCEDIGAIMTFTGLRFAADNATGASYANYEVKCNELYSKIMFFELEFTNLSSEKMEELINCSGKYQFYLQNLKDNKRYKLSLSEEKIMLALSPVGSEAFARLFDESLSNMRFKGPNGKIGEEEILALLHVSSRKTRKLAHKNFTKGLKSQTHLLAYVMNMVRKEVSIVQKLRGYEKPESFRHLANQTTQESVDSMIDCVNANMHLVHGYYRIKSQILGLRLKDYDRYAPLGFSKNGLSIDFGEALDHTLAAFKQFSPVFYDIASRAISEGWIDSHPRPAKRGGAFSHGSVPRSHPYILLNFTGSRRDAFTVAHEFGHAIHQELSKGRGTLSHDTPLTTAETASVFSEMLLFASLKKSLSKKELLDMYAGKIEDIFSTLFRQIVMTNFERAIHGHEGEISVEMLDKIWLDENQKMFGSSVLLTKKYSRWWSYIPHFVHSPFYCYAYSYGQLVVLALFGLYKKSEDKEKFVQTYIDFLSAGGSKSPRDLILSFGFDVNQKEFWDVGMGEVRNLLVEFEGLLNSYYD